MLILNRIKSFVFAQERRSSGKSFQHSHKHINNSDSPFLARRDPLGNDKLLHLKHIEACSTLQR